MMISFYAWTALVIFVGWNRPYVNKSAYIFELTNEFFIVLVLYFMFVLLVGVTDRWTINCVGWMLIGIIGFNLAFNLTTVLYDIVIEARRIIKNFFATKK